MGTTGAWGCLSRGRGREAARLLPPPPGSWAQAGNILCGDLGTTLRRHCPRLPSHPPPTPEGMARDWQGWNPRLPPLAALTSSGPSPGSPGGVCVFGVGASHGGSHSGAFHPPGVEVHLDGPSQLAHSLRLPQSLQGPLGLQSGPPGPPCLGPACWAGGPPSTAVSGPVQAEARPQEVEPTREVTSQCSAASHHFLRLA